MPFLYDVWNVKLQLYAKGLVWSRGGKHLSKTFSIFYMLNSKNGVFNPYFSIGTCPMRKRLLWISRGLNLLSFSYKKYHFLWNSSLVIFMGNPSLRLSEVLYFGPLLFRSIKALSKFKEKHIASTDRTETLLIEWLVPFCSRYKKTGTLANSYI